MGKCSGYFGNLRIKQVRLLQVATILLVSTIWSAACNASGWECINRNGVIPTCNTWRMMVPHGWLVSVDNNDHGAALTYYPDDGHVWLDAKWR